MVVSRETLTSVIRRIVEVTHPERVVLFGSHARGEAAERSDLDLLVVAETPRPRYERSAPI